MKSAVCFGDSITYGYGVRAGNVWHQLMKEKLGLRIINRGQNGDSILGMKIRLQRDVLESGADFCFFMAGSNDLMGGNTPEDIFMEVKNISERINSRGIKTIILSPPPAVPEMAVVSWDSLPDYSNINSNLQRLSNFLQEEFKENFIDVHMSFLNCSGRLSDLYLDGIHLNEAGNAYLGDIIIKSTIFRTFSL